TTAAATTTTTTTTTASAHPPTSTGAATAASTCQAVRGAEGGRQEARRGQGEDPHRALRRGQDHAEAHARGEARQGDCPVARPRAAPAQPREDQADRRPVGSRAGWRTRR